MKQKIYRDILAREQFKNKESRTIGLKIMIRLNQFSYLEVFDHLSKIKKRNSITKIHNICSITSRRHSINRATSISRIKLRELSKTGSILGFKKISW